jgi:hypothetical protein
MEAHQHQWRVFAVVSNEYQIRCVNCQLTICIILPFDQR